MLLPLMQKQSCDRSVELEGTWLMAQTILSEVYILMLY